MMKILALFLLFIPGSFAAAGEQPFEIRVVDAETGRGIPLIQLVTVDGVRFVTDNAGRIALREPGYAGRTIFFSVEPQGYEVPKDGFGIEGVRVKIEPGKAAEVKLKRINLAERLYRLTGEGLYRDSVLLGHETPLKHPLGSGRVAGQDSIQAALYRGKIYWFWGDTSRLEYPLGVFRMTGAVSELPANGGLPPAQGIDYDYFTDAKGFARAMSENREKEGVVWIFGLCVVKDSTGRDRMVGHYSRRRGLGEELQQGMTTYDDEREIFEEGPELPLGETWRFLQNHPIHQQMDGKDYLAFGVPFPVVRVPAEYEAVIDRDQYEAFTCIAPGEDPDTARPRRNADGQLDWQWQAAGPPTTQEQERRWLKAGLVKQAECRFLPADAAQPDQPVVMHTGSVQWNPWRRRWVLIASEYGMHRKTPSFLGEVYYSEAESPQGPYLKAAKILTHDQQSFYNACHHPFFDEQGGQAIYFEGTYCNTFTTAPATPRYNYNQMMYRLDLNSPRLREVFPENRVPN